MFETDSKNIKLVAERMAPIRKEYRDTFSVTVDHLEGLSKNESMKRICTDVFILALTFQDPSGEEIMEGLVEINKMLKAHSAITECSKTLEYSLKRKLNKKNAVLFSIAAIAALYAIGFVLGGPVVPATAWMYLWLGPAGGTMASILSGGIGSFGFLFGAKTTYQAILESGRLEKGSDLPRQRGLTNMTQSCNKEMTSSNQ